MPVQDYIQQSYQKVDNHMKDMVSWLGRRGRYVKVEDTKIYWEEEPLGTKTNSNWEAIMIEG
jgi:hypothetical protein